MAATPSNMMELGKEAPPFELPDATSGMRDKSLEDLRGDRGTVVVFICNHCPYVIHILERFVQKATQWQPLGIKVVAISSNDISKYPQDSPERMSELGNEWKFVFPYLYDETQDVAREYRAACTPDFYLFDADVKLVYRGQFDDSRPSNDVAVTGADLDRAVKALIDQKPIDPKQYPSIGCNIKWKES